jgi:hypothetical protein
MVHTVLYLISDYIETKKWSRSPRREIVRPDGFKKYIGGRMRSIYLFYDSVVLTGRARGKENGGKSGGKNDREREREGR